MGIATVAIYSQADAEALHVALADESYCVGGASAGESYLQEERIVSAALASGAQAIHPGYGFLSENAHFAALCRKQGLVFIGPTPESMEALSDKAKLKEKMQAGGLSVIPGTQVLSTVKEALAAARKIGYPVMLKAVAGGGGRGIRMVQSPEEMETAYSLAVAEGEAAFGDGSVYMEKYVHPSRHIEVQVLADEAGHVVCLGERDCSIQRHHQKLIEESPSPAVSPVQRKNLMKLSAKAVKSLGYVGVGTLEFLLDQAGRFWFMEMNVRLQVEHGVTEMLTKIDLVKWQIRAAAGVELTFTQEDVDLRGAAAECRINALAPGTLQTLHVPGGPFVRFDTYLVAGVPVSPYYDSLLGKLIVYAGTREEAMRKMKAALCELVIEGIPTNIEEQLDIVSDERFMTGQYDLTFMEGR
jgi:acetyl-CoA carboxylase biotin carboxylase subunit